MNFCFFINFFDIFAYLVILPNVKYKGIIKMSINNSINKRYEYRSKILKTMAHPTRLFIIDELNKGKKCVQELTEMIGHDVSTVSKHLSVLRNAGIIKSEKIEKKVYYELICPCVLNFFTCVDEVIQENVNEQLKIINDNESGGF